MCATLSACYTYSSLIAASTIRGQFIGFVLFLAKTTSYMEVVPGAYFHAGNYANALIATVNAGRGKREKEMKKRKKQVRQVVWLSQQQSRRVSTGERNKKKENFVIHHFDRIV